MDLKLDELQLLADFRRLDPAGQKELLDYAAFLGGKARPDLAEVAELPENQCRLADQPEERPEAAKEPIFTE